MQELLPIIVAVARGTMEGSVVSSVVDTIKGGYCKDPSMASMLRCLFLQFNVILTAVHVAGVDSGLPMPFQE